MCVCVCVCMCVCVCVCVCVCLCVWGCMRGVHGEFVIPPPGKVVEYMHVCVCVCLCWCRHWIYSHKIYSHNNYTNITCIQKYTLIDITLLKIPGQN